MEIKRFNNFNNQDTLYIFDMDDTIVDTPGFSELAIKYLNESNIESLLKMSIRKIGVTLNDLKIENGRIYVDDPESNINVNSNWVRKGKRVYLYRPEIFNISDISLPIKATSLSNLYNSIENKCIVTARPYVIRSKIISKLSELGLEMPKYGLHMAPIGAKNLGDWKGEKIVQILKETGFKKACFYDDNAKYITKATRVVKEKLPNITWKTVKV